MRQRDGQALRNLPECWRLTKAVPACWIVQPLCGLAMTLQPSAMASNSVPIASSGSSAPAAWELSIWPPAPMAASKKKSRIKCCARPHPPAVLQRLQRERQILAQLNHPHIAAILDAGETPDGDPYFVMEYVDGVPITAYCDTHALSIERRLDLFLQVCERCSTPTVTSPCIVT